MKVTDNRIEAALRLCKGNISETAATLNLQRITIYRRLQQNPNLKQVKEEAAAPGTTRRQEPQPLTAQKVVEQMEEFIKVNGLPKQHAPFIIDYMKYLRTLSPPDNNSHQNTA